MRLPYVVSIDFWQYKVEVEVEVKYRTVHILLIKDLLNIASNICLIIINMVLDAVIQLLIISLYVLSCLNIVKLDERIYSVHL